MNKDEPITTEEQIKALFGSGMNAAALLRTLKEIRNLSEVSKNSR